MTREEWLKRAVRSMRPLLRKAGIKMRAKWQVSVSLGTKHNHLGLCWYEGASASGKTAHLFVSPVIGDPVEVLGVLLHEMIHASLPLGVHHGPKFAKACKQIGLEGKPTQALPGPVLKLEIARLSTFLGDYPHDALIVGKVGGGTKGGYWPVYVSPADERYRVQISERALTEYGPPVCPITGEQMTLATGRAPKWEVKPK